VARLELKIGSLSRKRLLLILAGLALVVTVVTAVTALGVQSPDSPGKGISRSDAVQMAWQHSGQGAVTVRSAEIKRNFVTGFDLPAHHWAWVVTFDGQWHLLCSGHVTDGSCDPTSEWVALDYYTGQWIASQHSYPAAP